METDIKEIIESIKTDADIPADVYTNVAINDDILCPFVVLNDSAVFLLAYGVSTEHIAADVSKICAALSLGSDGYIFIRSNGHVYYVDSSFSGKLVQVNDFYEGFFNLYFAITSGNLTGDDDVDMDDLINGEPREYEMLDDRRMIPTTRYDTIRTEIRKRIKPTAAEKKADKKSSFKDSLSKYRVVDGQKYVRKLTVTGQEEYIPVSDIDPDAFYMKTLFFGLFGVHRFSEGRIMYGILYLLTFGFFGVFWLTDLLSILSGNYRLKDGSYLDRPTDMKHALIMLPFGIAIGVGVLVLAYFVGSHIFGATGQALTSSIENDPEKQQAIINYLENHMSTQ